MKAIFFSPHSYFDIHAIPEALVGEALEQQGIEVLYVNCDGLYSKFCLCFSHISMYDEGKKKLICRSCRMNRDAIIQEFKFKSINLESLVSIQDHEVAQSLINSVEGSKYHDLVVDGIEIGKYSMYEFTLNHKLSSLEIPYEIIDEYKSILNNSLLTMFAIRKLITTYQPDRLVTYNSLYSVNRVVCAVGDFFKIPHFTLHAGGHHNKRIQQMTVFKGIEAPSLINKHSQVEESRIQPCTLAQIDLITEHVCELLKAKSPWVYSIKSNKKNSSDIRNLLGVKTKQKLLLAVMRSGDERGAAMLAGMKIFNSKPIFRNQIEWCSWLLDFAINNPDFFIVFRVHPREFPNKRENVTSKNAENLIKFFSELHVPSNFFINLPDQLISLHDLFKVTDLVLNNSSTAGLEASLFGIRVIGLGDDLYSFDPVLQKEPKSKEDYKSMIYEQSKLGWNREQVILSFRWLRYLFDHVAIDISDGYKDLFRNTFFNRHINRITSILKRLGCLPKFINMLNVKTRPKYLGQSEWLSYAIINNVDSHIGKKQLICGDAQSEFELIKNAYYHYTSLISCPTDNEFEAKTKKVFS